MPMEKHRCKLCSRSFLNGRALGGHMRSHLASKQQKHELGESDSSSTRSENEHFVKEVSFYELRDNPKKSVKALDPEFSSIVVVQDRESETESTQCNPTRRRSKRPSHQRENSKKKAKWVVVVSESAESTQVSSVSNPSQDDEEVAFCLMMLSRDAWETRAELKLKTTSARPVAKFKCLECKKVFRTGRALAGHKASNKQCCPQENYVGVGVGGDQKIFECPFCSKVFGSGQALGGHKRSHLISTSSNSNVVKVVGDDTTTCFDLDLNLPAPIEVDEDHNGNVDFVGSA